MARRSLVLASVSMALAALVSPLSAQEAEQPSLFGHVAIGFLLGEPVGEFDEFIGLAYGVGVSARYSLTPRDLVSVRADFGFMNYGHESKRVCIQGVGCRVQARLQTDNNIFFGGLGPELALPLDWVRPYVNALAGFSYFNTSSSLKGDWDEEDHFTTNNLGDGTFAWGLGGGIDVRVYAGRIPVSLNVEGRYLENGVMEYLTKGDIVDNPDGSITLYPNVSEANLVVYRFGVSIGIPRRWGEDASDGYRP